MNKNDEYILRHYQKVAKNFGNSSASSIQDPQIRKMEINFILKQISELKRKGHRTKSLLDIGCGNGFLLNEIHKSFPDIKLNGIEFTPELFHLSKERNIPNTKIVLGDCRNPTSYERKFDLAITERVVINLLEWEEQHQTFSNIAKNLNDYGHYIMVESFKEPWEELNRARREMSLDEIPVSKHNRYLNKQLPPLLKKLKLEKRDTCLPPNSLSTHFYISRIFHEINKPDGGRRKESRFVNFFSECLPIAVGNYSPILFQLYQKI